MMLHLVMTGVGLEGEGEVLVMMEILGIMEVMVVVPCLRLIMEEEADLIGTMEDLEGDTHMGQHMVMVVVVMEVSMDSVVMWMMVTVGWATIMQAMVLQDLVMVMFMVVEVVVLVMVVVAVDIVVVDTILMAGDLLERKER
jgi:hypothetical protein